MQQIGIARVQFAASFAADVSPEKADLRGLHRVELPANEVMRECLTPKGPRRPELGQDKLS